jgi:hypothetical protein
VKYRTLPRFEADYRRLSLAERAKFRDTLREFIAAASAYESSPERFIWPKSLRVERLTGSGVMAMTWSFSGPDGRATFQFETVDGQMFVVWRRVGRHQIYRQP